MAPEQETLRDDLVAAFKETTGENPDTSGAEPKGGGNDTPNKQSEPSLSKSPESGTETPQAPADDKPLEPPARWSKEEKEEFAGLDPRVQKLLLTRNKGLEGDYTRKMQEIAQERSRYTSLEQVLGPRRDTWQRQGLNDAQFLNNVISYWDLAQRDPLDFINTFARERGIDLASHYMPTAEEIAKVFQSNAGQYGDPNSPQAALPPQLMQKIDALSNDNMALKEYVMNQYNLEQQRQQQTYTSYRTEAASEIARFESEHDEHGSPLRPFFNDVRQDMVALMQAGIANTLQEAYDKSVYMRADVRGKLEESREVTRRRSEEQRRQEEASRARRAGSSVSSSPSTYSPEASDGDDDDGSIRSIISKQFEKAKIGARI